MIDRQRESKQKKHNAKNGHYHGWECKKIKKQKQEKILSDTIAYPVPTVQAIGKKEQK